MTSEATRTNSKNYKNPSKMASLVHKTQANKANSTRRAEAMVRIWHQSSVILSALCESYELELGYPTACSHSPLTYFPEPTLLF